MCVCVYMLLDLLVIIVYQYNPNSPQSDQFNDYLFKNQRYAIQLY